MIPWKKKKTEKRSDIGFLISPDDYDSLCCSDYVRLDRNPEVMAACRKIADLISSMTIHLMANTDSGDQRIVNELSRQVDITPNRYMTRKTWMDAIVMNLLLHGSGNSVVIPYTKDGLLDDMAPQPPVNVSFIQDGYGYYVMVNGIRHDPDDVLHFVWNPDENYPWKGKGFTATIKDVANNLKQATATEKSFMASKWKPSLIIKVDALVDEFSNPEGRQKLLKEYIKTNQAGEPWMVPAEQFDIQEVRPLSLNDLAIKDTVELDKRTVASIMGVPPFILGIGSYDSKEWDNFISSTIRPIAKTIEQELTRKLLLNPRWYFSFGVSSLYSYDLRTTADVYSNLYVRGIVDGNEVRDKLGMSPREGLDGLVILENYIPLDKVGDQLKLKQGEDNGQG